MLVRQGGWQSLVVARKPTEASQPSKAALDHPAPGQQHAAALGLGEFDDQQFDGVLGCRLGGLLARVALIDIGQIDAALGGFLHLPGQFADLCSLLFVGGCDQQRQKMTTRSNTRHKSAALQEPCQVWETSSTKFSVGAMPPELVKDQPLFSGIPTS